MSFSTDINTLSNCKTIMDNDYESLPTDWPVFTHMIGGAAAGILEHATMYPIDCIKTQMQSIRSIHYTGLWNAFTTIRKTDGLPRLMRGMPAMIIGAGPAHAMYFSCYEKVKYELTLKINGKKWKNSSIANGVAGATATIFHDLVMNPADVIKQRMQMYGSTHTKCRSCFKHIYQTEGFRAFYRSFPTQLQMNVPFQIIHFLVYEQTQELINAERVYNPVSHMVSGAVAGGTAAFCTNPWDVCRTLLNTQEHGSNSTIKGIADAAKVVYRTDGLKTFWRGVTARMLYQMPSTAISWSIYEFIKYSFKNSRHKEAQNEISRSTILDATSWVSPSCEAIAPASLNPELGK